MLSNNNLETNNVILIYYWNFIIDPYGACTADNVTIEINEDDEEVIITSPGYPEAYPDKADCRWHFTTEEGYVLAVDFTTFDMEAE